MSNCCKSELVCKSNNYCLSADEKLVLSRLCLENGAVRIKGDLSVDGTIGNAENRSTDIFLDSTVHYVKNLTFLNSEKNKKVVFDPNGAVWVNGVKAIKSDGTLNGSGEMGDTFNGNVIGDIQSSGESTFNNITVSGNMSGNLNGDVSGNVNVDEGLSSFNNLEVNGILTGDLTGNVTASTGNSVFNNITVNGSIEGNIDVTSGTSTFNNVSVSGTLSGTLNGLLNGNVTATTGTSVFTSIESANLVMKRDYTHVDNSTIYNYSNLPKPLEIGDLSSNSWGFFFFFDGDLGLMQQNSSTDAPNLYNVNNIPSFRWNGKTSGQNVFSFTGKHICHYNFMKDDALVGRIVEATGKHKNFNGELQVDQCIPIVDVCNRPYNAAAFGVISKFANGTINVQSGGMTTQYSVADPLVYVNSLGEGQVWVCNRGGDIKNGDYICSYKAGYGRRQDDNILHNYTVAKATQDVNFKNAKKVRIDGKDYRAVLIGCTYHCG